jgi:uncharacterized membrane protein
MSTSLLGSLFFGLAGICLFVLFVAVCFIVGVVVYRLIAKKKELEKVDLSDGISAEELAIIRDALFAKRSAEVEAKVKADVIEALKSK